MNSGNLVQFKENFAVLIRKYDDVFSMIDYE